MEFRELDLSDIEIKTGIHESAFLKNFLEDEFLAILKNEELKNNKLYIYKSYIYEKKEYIEIGVYIINTSEKNVFIKSLPLTITNNEHQINQSLDIQDEIGAGQALFRELKIDRYLLNDNYMLDNFKVLISNLSSLEKYEPIELELNIEPKFKGYISRREFDKFIKNLPRINDNSLAINIFKKGYVEDGYFISILFRNSSESDLVINTLPIVVMTANNLIIHENTITFKDNNCKIPSNKAVLKNILIPFNKFPLIPKMNGMDFKITFKNI